LDLRVHNTLTGLKEKFIPREDGKVSIYICGVTPYSDTHLGHVRPSVVWDTVIRYLEYMGYQVHAVQNITDVNDKIVERARREGATEREVADRYIEDYEWVMEALGVRELNSYPRVSEHMDEIIRMIEGLVQKGHAYEAGGDVYFDVTSFPAYGKLSGQSLETVVAGSRVEISPRKRHPADFALWKAAGNGEPAWESPWGPGRPGWHIECSAMALEHLGMGFDFHGGGTDLVFPHHENEIAQSEAFTGETPFVRYWVHHNMVNLDGEKMAKSRGNFMVARELLRRIRPEALRLLLISSHYRSPITYSDELLDESRRSWNRLDNFRRALAHLTAQDPAGDVPLAGQEAQLIDENTRQLVESFNQAMQDDFNTARALAALFDFVRRLNSLVATPGFVLSDAVHESLLRTARQFDRFMAILGLLPPDTGGVTGDLDRAVVHHLLEILIEAREQARADKSWSLADMIRDRLAEIGCVLEDTPQGTRWRLEEDRET